MNSKHEKKHRHGPVERLHGSVVVLLLAVTFNTSGAPVDTPQRVVEVCAQVLTA